MTGQPDPAVPAVDLADQTFDLVAFLLVVLHAFPGRRGDLDEHVPLRIEHPGFEQRAERAQPQADALRVVEPVDAEQDHLRVAEAGPDLRSRAGGWRARRRSPPPRRCRSRSGTRRVWWRGRRDTMTSSLLGHVEELGGRRGEVGDAARGLEADQVAAEQTLDDLGPPRQPGEQLERRERDVEEESDRQIGPLLAEHRRHQLELVVVHPHGGVRRRRRWPAAPRIAR